MSPRPKRHKIDEYLAFAQELAREGGEHTLKYFRKGVDFELKADDSPVTVADRETEQLMRARILEKYPDHGVLGEEFGESNPGARWRWILDPIDGTKSFISGIPLYTVLIGLECSGEAHLGVIHNPALDETVAAATDLGCTFNGQPTCVRPCESLDKAWVHTTDFCELKRRRPKFTDALLEKSLYSRTWADAYGYLLVATGRADVMVDPIMSLWDLAAVGPVIREAGGKFTDLNGNDSLYTNSALATAGPLHAELLEMLKLD